jgi:hypothetical protein
VAIRHRHQPHLTPLRCPIVNTPIEQEDTSSISIGITEEKLEAKQGKTGNIVFTMIYRHNLTNNVSLANNISRQFSYSFMIISLSEVTIHVSRQYSRGQNATLKAP